MIGIHELITSHLENVYGEGVVEATEGGKIKFLFPTTHHGANEMEVGIWKNKSKLVTTHITLGYTEAYEYLKAGTKPDSKRILSINSVKTVKV